MFYFTQTSLKDLENEETCPFRWKKQWIDREIKFPSNAAMNKGSYFEHLVLGAGAIAGTEVLDLPRLKNGEKSAEHKRIDEQAERVKGMLFDKNSPEYLGLAVTMTQLEIIKGNKKGTYDIVAVDEEIQDWIVDLKLTADLTSERTKYSYGNDWDAMDQLQLTHYVDLFYEEFGKKPRAALLVVDYSPSKRVRFQEIVITDVRKNQKDIRFKAGEDTVQLYEKHGWVKIPNEKECLNCPLTCDKRI